MMNCKNRNEECIETGYICPCLMYERNEMTNEEKILNMRMNEFGLSKQVFLGKKKKDTFPECIDVVKWVKTEPRKVFSVELGEEVLSREYCYVIGTLRWDDGWNFESCGIRYLEDCTEELNRWLVDFCEKWVVENGEIRQHT